MKSNSSICMQQTTVFQRQLLIKYGHILKKQIQRWYEINLKEQSIDYFLSRNTNKLKGKIPFKQIASIEAQVKSLNQELVVGDGKFQNYIHIFLSNQKQIYLFQQDIIHLDQLMNVLNMYQRGQRQQENKITNMETFRYQEKSDNNSAKNKNIYEKQEIEFVQVIPTEHSCYVQLMPESVSQRNIAINKQEIQNEESINNSLKSNIKSSYIKEDENVKKISKKTHQIEKKIQKQENQKKKIQSKIPAKEELNNTSANRAHVTIDQFEDQCLKFNDEITEVLSREETENTNRVHIFSKLQNFNENFQIQKIKKQIHNSSNNLYKLTQDSNYDNNIIKTNQSNYNLNNIQQPLSASNQDQYKYTTLPSLQSQLIKNPISNAHHQSTTSFKQFPDIPLNTTTLGNSNIGNSFRFNTYMDSHRENDQLINYPCQDQDLSNILLNREIDRNTYSLIQQQEIKFQDEDEENPMHLSTTIRQRIDKQCSNETQNKQEYQQQSNYDYQQRQSISEIQSESNLASIKQLNCEIKGKPFLKESITLELQNEFKKQSYFYQEFNTLLTLNTQYLGGSLINTKTLNVNKRNSIQSYKNNRSLTLDQATEKSVQSYTPKQRDMFLQGSITNRTIAGNSIKQYLSQDCESQNQFGPLIFPIQEDYDGYSEDYYINSDKDIDQQSDLNESNSQKNRFLNRNNLIYSSTKYCSKKFPRSSNFNASFMRSERKDTDSINSNHQQKSSQNQENGNLSKQNGTTQVSSNKFQGTRLNQIPIEVYYQKKFQSDSNLLIDFGSETTDANQIFQEDDQINASNNMLAIQKVQLVTKTKSDQDSQQALSYREHSNNLTQLNSQPQTPHIKDYDNSQNQQIQQNQILNLNLPQQYINQSTLNVQNSAIYSNTPIKSEYNVAFSPSRYFKQNNLDVQSINNASLEISKREQSLASLKSHNLSKIGLDKAMKLVWDFQFTKAACVFEDFSNQENVNMIIGHIYMLLIQFLISLKIDFAEKLCKLCEQVIDHIINQRAKNNIYLSLVQEINLTEMYLIKGILQFSLDKKIQGLFSLKNAFKYYQKCQSATLNLVNSLKKNHRLKLNLLEGLSNLAKSALQESFKKVLSFFGQTFDLDKGLKTLLQVSQADNNDQQNSSSSKINQLQFDQEQLNNKNLEDQKYIEYIKASSGEDDLSFTSHVATIVLSLYYIWREKNPNPIVNLINQKLKQYPKSPIYYWISYLINFEKRENLKAINDINKALSKANSFSKSCLSFKFEKSLFLTSNLRWNEASQILGQIGVQLLNFEEFKFEEFKQMLQKAKINSNYFSNFYRSCVIDYKPEKHFFIGISSLLLSQVACLIQQNQLDFAKEWLLLSQYFKKHSYLNIFLSNDIHNLSQIYLRRKNFNLVKYEIMYFTKTITKIPNSLIDQLILEINEEEISLKQKQIKSNEDQKELAIEQSSCIFLKILVGCLQFDDKMIEKGEQELAKIPKYVNDSKYSDFSYLFHHSYYWICKFYFLQQKYDEALKNIKQMQKFSTKIFSLSQQADNILKIIKNQEYENKEQK
ncbi:hypothetical protein TTHERM_00219560 (macronuclear) [Tetrahymena thermophila SB210]|uniref:Tetratricopeptide repeat protein n=1 Tax=Tetrahymena thermophila (strain SB210) TaxID=312017 RepID=I7M902_TETTS|nr:hypothetical protein TTHERM_00219560 [Tetrahymena thermophila SB210]EAS00382.2 hypothetical protein TTHERM_00219560 [Tetrahymena thermophila SB210]|eukprot:XP_001020627.2 hypothetical protein TTHERM_00219560 [Tetrahymena thermophila SB210]